MFCLNDSTRYFLCPGSTDMRKGMFSLSGPGKNERGCPEWRCVHFYQQAEKPYKASARRNGRSGDVRETA